MNDDTNKIAWIVVIAIIVVVLAVLAAAAWLLSRVSFQA